MTFSLKTFAVSLSGKPKLIKEIAKGSGSNFGAISPVRGNEKGVPHGGPGKESGGLTLPSKLAPAVTLLALRGCYRRDPLGPDSSTSQNPPLDQHFGAPFGFPRPE